MNNTNHLDQSVFSAGVALGIDCDYIAKYYFGSFGSVRDFAIKYLENYGELESVPDHLQNYIDYDAYGRDLLSDCVSEYNGHYFIIG